MQKTWGSTCLRYQTKFHSNELYTVLTVIILKGNKGLNAFAATFQMFGGYMNIKNALHFTLNGNKHYHVLLVYEYNTKGEVHGV